MVALLYCHSFISLCTVIYSLSALIVSYLLCLTDFIWLHTFNSFNKFQLQLLNICGNHIARPKETLSDVW